MMISIIIPIYNGEKYIKDCLDNIFNQTYKNYEIIIVDDGSIDDSKKIIDSFNNKKIKYIYTNHFGVSKARNIGLKNAKGKYICFIDSDDVLSKYYLEKMLEQMKQKIDLSICSYTKNKVLTNINKTITIDKYNTYKIILTKKVSGYVWNKLFLKNIIDDNHLKFDENICMGEDILFCAQYLQYCSKISVNYSKLYYYRKHKKQITNKYDNSIISVLNSWEKIVNIYKKECPIMLNEIKYRYLKKSIELNNCSINYKEFNFKQKIILMIYKLFYKQILFIKKGL